MDPLSFADDLVGKPFQAYGRGPYAYDCVGVVLAISRELFGVELPDPLSAECYDPGGFSALSKHFLRLDGLAGLQPGDVIHYPWSTEQHLAIVERPGWVIHTTTQSVVRSRLGHVIVPSATAYRPKRLALQEARS